MQWFYCCCCLALAGLVAADVLAIRWWFEERQLVVDCQVVKTALVCQISALEMPCAEAVYVVDLKLGDLLSV